MSAAGPPPGGDIYGYGYGGYYAALAEWPERVGAYLIDALISSSPVLLGSGIFFVDLIWEAGKNPDGGPPLYTILILPISILVGIGLALWNRVFRQGETGQSVGKTVMHLKLVDAASYQPIGPGKAFLREFLAGIFNNACFVNMLWPLFDEQKQTWHDKVMTTYVIKV